MSVFKDFSGLENLEKLFQDFQGPARAVDESQQVTGNKPFGAVHFIFCLSGKSGWLNGHDV